MRLLALLLAVSFLFSSDFALARRRSLQMAPPDFSVPGLGKAVFVDFLSADYRVIYDIVAKRTRVESKIVFRSESEGMPIFDLIDEPERISVDGHPASQRLVHPSSAAEDGPLRVVEVNVVPGLHVLRVEHELKEFGATFGGDSVSSGFFISDFEARGLYERFVPSNLEFDQVQMRLDVEVLGAGVEHRIFTNGTLAKLGRQRWSIRFPDYFNSSAPFFHIRPAPATTVLQYLYESIDGRQIPVVIYQNADVNAKLADFKAILDTKMPEFERHFGPFPHASMTVFHSGGMGGGGMEYSGATFTDLWALEHELAHSYFGRGVMAANGNAGWVDEAMASLVTNSWTNPDSLKPTNMASHSPYFRANDSKGYYEGLNFLAYLGREFTKANPALNLNRFLKTWVAEKLRAVSTTPDLQSSLESYSGMKLGELFDKYVYGKSLQACVSGESSTASQAPRGYHANVTAEVVKAVQ